MAVLFSQSKIRGTSEKNIQTSEIKSGVPRIKNDALTSYISKEADKTFLKDMLLKFAPVTKTHHRTAMYRLSNLMAMEPFKIFVTQLLLDKNISNDAKASFISHADISSDYMYQVLLNIKKETGKYGIPEYLSASLQGAGLIARQGIVNRT